MLGSERFERVGESKGKKLGAVAVPEADESAEKVETATLKVDADPTNSSAILEADERTPKRMSR